MSVLHVSQCEARFSRVRQAGGSKLSETKQLRPCVPSRTAFVLKRHNTRTPTANTKLAVVAAYRLVRSSHDSAIGLTVRPTFLHFAPCVFEPHAGAG